ncbi:MAG: ABC transporter ATP-binding protein [Chlorobi bacterium]|nr:ABC transporter ATP-binding protein [Chlorobiota bacterium]
MIEIKNVSKKFENTEALKGVSLKVEKGEFFGLLGPNGAGKTTLMNIIVGYLKPDEGKVFIDGTEMKSDDVSLREKIGYVPQDIGLYQELTAMQNLKIFGSFYNHTKKELNERIEQALELVQLNDRRKDVVKEFSGGMKRRLNIAASLLHDPEIILCDEPTVGVDPQSRNAIFEMLQKLNADGKTLIYTTHYMEEAERLCNRMAIIDYGKIIAGGTLSELIDLLHTRETLKIRKTKETEALLGEIKKLGVFSEHDFYFEIRPNENYDVYSKLFADLETIGLDSKFVEISRASLEDVFLYLTGRSLRD